MQNNKQSTNHATSNGFRYIVNQSCYLRYFSLTYKCMNAYKLLLPILCKFIYENTHFLIHFSEF